MMLQCKQVTLLFSADFCSIFCLKPLLVTTNVVGLQTDDADHVGQNSSAHVARVVGLQTDAVVVTETRFSTARIFDEFGFLAVFKVQLICHSQIGFYLSLKK